MQRRETANDKAFAARFRQPDRHQEKYQRTELTFYRFVERLL